MTSRQVSLFKVPRRSSPPTTDTRASGGRSKLEAPASLAAERAVPTGQGTAAELCWTEREEAPAAPAYRVEHDPHTGRMNFDSPLD